MIGEGTWFTRTRLVSQHGWTTLTLFTPAALSVHTRFCSSDQRDIQQLMEKKDTADVLTHQVYDTHTHVRLNSLSLVSTQLFSLYNQTGVLPCPHSHSKNFLRNSSSETVVLNQAARLIQRSVLFNRLTEFRPAFKDSFPLLKRQSF